MNYELAIAISKQPKNFKKIEDTTHEGRATNQRCGDDFAIYLSVKDNFIKDASFEGEGCALSIAAFSILTEAIKNKKVNEAKIVGEEEIKKTLKIEKKDSYSKCAFLALDALKRALEDKR